MRSKIVKAFWSNFFFKKCDKLDRNIDIFTSSKFINKFFDIGFKITDKVKGLFFKSKLNIFLKNFWAEFSSKPIKLFSLFVISAVLTNLILTLIFKEFDLTLTLIKLFVIILCLIGLKINFNLDKLKQNSLISNKIEKIYNDL
jgi:hypothetical protein